MSNIYHEKISYVNACDFPNDVEEELMCAEISTHYQNSVASVSEDDLPLFYNWLLKHQVIEPGFDGSIAIMAT